ncbi:C6 zinc finger domain-containing protein [Pleurostoma richardsiae]|uniref:C6 zinc finger domain-containing protein n=1 Tax=Pleurostoma richardsiae TaxID=41990 RepID=A0AA38VN15_9PEZI|nr:C6 zinc finger domain-containing protein [Pleurostoma richardsiae]
MLDLELLHNYSTSTYATFTWNPTLRTLYKNSMVQLGLRCDYIMRSILAISALHLARHRPDRKDFYTSHAVMYHQQASRKAMSEMTDSVEDNVENLFAFSILTIFFALGSPRQTNGSMLLIEESRFPDWMFLVTGTRSLVHLIGEANLVQGPLGPLNIYGQERWDLAHKNVEPRCDYLAELQELICKSYKGDSDTLHKYMGIVDSLRRSYVVFYETPVSDLEMTDAFVWVFDVAEHYLPLLKVPTQESVAIFAYFCVLLKRVDNHWWLQGWADHLMSRTYRLLDDEHKLWIQWPIEEMGWTPGS